MKINLIYAAIITVLSVSSCTKENENSNPINNSAKEKPISFKVDGALIEADSTTAIIYNLDFAPYDRKLDIIGYKAGKIIFEGNFFPNAGKQTLGDGGNSLITYKPGADLNEHFASKNGTLTLSKCDTITPEIIGTFETMLGQVLGGSQIKIISEGKLKVIKLVKR
jgi:hypothetical protein